MSNELSQPSACAIEHLSDPCCPSLSICTGESSYVIPCTPFVTPNNVKSKCRSAEPQRTYGGCWRHHTSDRSHLKCHGDRLHGVPLHRSCKSLQAAHWAQAMIA